MADLASVFQEKFRNKLAVYNEQTQLFHQIKNHVSHNILDECQSVRLMHILLQADFVGKNLKEIEERAATRACVDMTGYRGLSEWADVCLTHHLVPSPFLTHTMPFRTQNVPIAIYSLQYRVYPLLVQD